MIAAPNALPRLLPMSTPNPDAESPRPLSAPPSIAPDTLAVSLRSALNPQPSTSAPASVSLEGFPQDEETRAALYWMGDDYARTLATRLSRHLAADDPTGTMLALRCLQPPKLNVDAAEDDGRVLAVDADFSVEAIMRSGDGSRWALRIALRYQADQLDRDDGGHIRSEASVEAVNPA